MDASDTTKKRKATAYFINQNNTFVRNNSAGDCAVSTCCYATSSCIRTFNSYDEKYLYYNGLNNCRGCSVPVNGGSK